MILWLKITGNKWKYHTLTVTVPYRIVLLRDFNDKNTFLRLNYDWVPIFHIILRKKKLTQITDSCRSWGNFSQPIFSRRNTSLSISIAHKNGIKINLKERERERKIL